MEGFQTVKNYLDNLWTDIQDPCHFQYLFVPVAQIPIDPTVDDSHVDSFLKSCMCAYHPYGCWAKLKFKRFKWEVHCIMKVFHMAYRKFLTAIYHIGCHPSQVQNNIMGTRGSVACETYRYCHSPTRTLTPSGENYLTAFVQALSKIDPSWHWNLSRIRE